MSDVLDQQIIFSDSLEEKPEVTVTVSEPSAVAPIVRQTRMMDILDLIEDPESSLVECQRMIAMEIAAVTNNISLGISDPTNIYKMKAYEQQIKALRELAKTMTEADTLSKKDILNFDGPKFQYVYREIIILFKKAVLEAGYSDETVNGILKLFRDRMAMREPDLRREVEKVERQEWIK